MKSLWITRTGSATKFRANLLLYSTILIVSAAAFMGCQKEAIKPPVDGPQSVTKHTVTVEGDVVNDYGLSPQTTWELQQARAATARYRDIKNAIKDGYSNINVDVPNMGHHFMNMGLVDGTFDMRKPEILVYNGLDTGNPELVAVEYAVPLTDPLPEGFTGSADVWDGNSGFPFWLVHAWVWKFNPAGVFNPTNPDVDLD